MAEPGDKGRHRRGSRWWRGISLLRGPELPRRIADRFTERTPDRGVERISDRFTERTGAERTSDRLAERTGIEQTRDRFTERTGAEQTWDRFTNRASDRSIERAWDHGVERTPDRSAIDRVGTVTAPVLDDRPRYTWRDFELDSRSLRAAPHPPDAPDLRDGRRHCGLLERILHREWDATHGPPSADAVRAVDSLARLPDSIKVMLAAGLDGIYIGRGGVPDLDDMGYLRGAPLPSGRVTWDLCAGAYGDRKIVVGDRPSPTPDVMLHEVGHALDDVDAGPGQWVSDSVEFAALYEKCLPKLASAFHRQPGDLGRKEFFADAFAAIASGQRPALVDMLGGDTRTALDVMLFFNRRYGI